jgi:sec-independent protein translocase protein TatA
MGEFSPWHWAIVAVVFIALFGARRLPDAARGIGQSLRIFKAEMKAGNAEETTPPPLSTTEPPAAQQSVASESPAPRPGAQQSTTP